MSVPITLPRYLSKPARFKSSGTGWDRLTVALCFALSVRDRGTAEAIQGTARRLVDRVRMEHKSSMRRLARGVEIPKEKTIDCVVMMVNITCAEEGISPAFKFEP